jgi:hypothetical protein
VPPAATRARSIDAALWALTAASGVATLWFSLGGSPPGANAFAHADKVGHAVAYFATTLLLLLAAVWRPGRGPGPLDRYRWQLLGAILIAGAGIELLQVPIGREAEVWDWLVEVAAVLAAFGVVEALRRRAA